MPSGCLPPSHSRSDGPNNPLAVRASGCEARAAGDRAAEGGGAVRNARADARGGAIGARQLWFSASLPEREDMWAEIYHHCAPQTGGAQAAAKFAHSWLGSWNVALALVVLAGDRWR